MNTRLIKCNTYTQKDLTGISKRCDWFINGTQILQIKNDNDPQYIFLTAYNGNVGIKTLVNTIIGQLKKPFVLIIASEDYTFPSGKGDIRANIYEDCQDLIQILTDHPLLVHIFVENLDIKHEKMTAIPLGLLEENVSIDDTKFFNIDFSKKTDTCFICNRIRNDGSQQWNDRKMANELSKTKWKDFTNCIEVEITYTHFIEELKNHRFCLIIHGGGYDPCPKFFECILYGTIPIIQHSPLDEVFRKFPVVFIDELHDNTLSAEFLKNEYEKLKGFYEGDQRCDVLPLLTIQYWWNMITDKLLHHGK